MKNLIKESIDNSSFLGNLKTKEELRFYENDFVHFLFNYIFPKKTLLSYSDLECEIKEIVIKEIFSLKVNVEILELDIINLISDLEEMIFAAILHPRRNNSHIKPTLSLNVYNLLLNEMKVATSDKEEGVNGKNVLALMIKNSSSKDKDIKSIKLMHVPISFRNLFTNICNILVKGFDKKTVLIKKIFESSYSKVVGFISENIGKNIYYETVAFDLLKIELHKIRKRFENSKVIITKNSYTSEEESFIKTLNGLDVKLISDNSRIPNFNERLMPHNYSKEDLIFETVETKRIYQTFYENPSAKIAIFYESSESLKEIIRKLNVLGAVYECLPPLRMCNLFKALYILSLALIGDDALLIGTKMTSIIFKYCDMPLIRCVKKVLREFNAIDGDSIKEIFHYLKEEKCLLTRTDESLLSYLIYKVNSFIGNPFKFLSYLINIKLPLNIDSPEEGVIYFINYELEINYEFDYGFFIEYSKKYDNYRQKYCRNSKLMGPTFADFDQFGNYYNGLFTYYDKYETKYPEEYENKYKDYLIRKMKKSFIIS